MKLLHPLFALLAVSCAAETAVPLTQSELSSEAQVIRTLDAALSQAAQAQDAVLFASFFADDAIQMPPNAPALNGRASIQESAAGLLGPGVSLRFETQNVRIARLGDLATSRGKYYLVIEAPTGLIQDEGSFVEVWEKLNGDWKITLDIYNSDVPTS